MPVQTGGDTRSTYSDLASVYLPVALAVLLIVAIALAVVAFRFRARPGRTPSSERENHKLEAPYVVLLAVISGLLLWQTYEAVDEVEPLAAAQSEYEPTDDPDLVVAVTASRWNWRFAYPGGVVQTDGVGEDDATLVVPEDRLVRIRLRSTDVAHAFWIPSLRVKYDAYPTKENVFDIRFDRGLDYSTARCSEFCGQFHDQMTFNVEVLPPAQFDEWLEQRRDDTEETAS